MVMALARTSVAEASPTGRGITRLQNPKQSGVYLSAVETPAGNLPKNEI